MSLRGHAVSQLADFLSPDPSAFSPCQLFPGACLNPPPHPAPAPHMRGLWGWSKAACRPEVDGRRQPLTESVLAARVIDVAETHCRSLQQSLAFQPCLDLYFSSRPVQPLAPAVIDLMSADIRLCWHLSSPPAPPPPHPQGRPRPPSPSLYKTTIPSPFPLIGN